MEDVEKYADSDSQRQYIRHVIAHIFKEGGTKVTFERFGESGYRYRYP